MKIDLIESEYRTILNALAVDADETPSRAHERAVLRLRDNLRVRWERAADEQQRKELVK